MEIVVLGLWVICAFISYSQAKKKHLNAPLWAFIGLIFGVFGVIAALIVKPKQA